MTEFKKLMKELEEHKAFLKKEIVRNKLLLEQEKLSFAKHQGRAEGFLTAILIMFLSIGITGLL
jgi:hypothetical protein